MRKLRKKFKKPKVSWEINSIKENKAIASEFGLRRKREILHTQQILRNYRQRARLLIAKKDEVEEKILIQKLAKLGILNDKNRELDDILALTIADVLNRRLQTIIGKNPLATSVLHARQLITHGHVRIDKRRITFPSYLVTLEEEAVIKVELPSVKPKPIKSAVPQEETSDEGENPGNAEVKKPTEEKPVETEEKKVIHDD